MARTRAYVLRHLDHEHYNFEYLGYNFNQPPTTTAMKWLRATAPFVETGLTVPVTTLALAAIGAGVLARRRRGEPVDPESEQPEAPTAERPSWLRPGRRRRSRARAPSSSSRRWGRWRSWPSPRRRSSAA